MVDRKTVIKELTRCIKHDRECTKCFYRNETSCTDVLMYDALALLKEQEPRVMTLEEVLENTQEIGFPCWVEDHIENIDSTVLVPAVVTSDDIYIQYTGNDYYEGAIYHWAYNKRLRCWISHPTDEQRKLVKWK